MKLFINLIGMAAAGILGYQAEPSLRFQLTGVPPSAAEMARNKKIIVQVPGGVPPVELTSLTPEQLPQRILLKTDVKMTDSAAGVMMILQAGNRVKLLRIEGGNAVVSPGDGPFRGEVPVTDTDLPQQLAASPPETVTAAVMPTGGESEEPAATPAPPPVPQSAPALAPQPQPEPQPTPVSTPEPAATPEPTAAEPTNPVEPSPTQQVASTDAVKVMQDSIRTAQIKEFTFEQVLDWKPSADELVDGETYQTGMASYKAETIFGVKTIQAKALIKGGKVQRWIWPKSGMEIK